MPYVNSLVWDIEVYCSIDFFAFVDTLNMDGVDRPYPSTQVLEWFRNAVRDDRDFAGYIYMHVVAPEVILGTELGRSYLHMAPKFSEGANMFYATIDSIDALLAANLPATIDKFMEIF